MSLEFEWDAEKAKQNRKKHHVSFEEAATVFGDLLSVTIPDPAHSEDEDRLVMLGESDRLRLVVVCFTYREGRVRIISARLANRKERKKYEEGE